MPQLPECLGFDLANALAGDAEFATDLFQRSLAAIVEPEAQRDDAALTLRQRTQHVVHGVAQQRLGCLLDWRDCLGILDQIAQLAVLVVADRGCQTPRVPSGPASLHHALRGALEL